MARPFVSVLIDTYNHERFVAEAVQSVLAQDFPASDREILVVDDGSSDKTPDILRKFEPDIRILRKTNGGQANAFNHGIPECRGEIVAFLDGDDWWAPTKVSRVVQAMSADTNLGIVGHGIISVQQDGFRSREILREGFRFQANTLEGAHLLRRRGAFLGTSRMTIRTDLLRQIGLVPEEIRIQADEFLFTIAATMAQTEILPDALTYYRLHDANNFQMASYDPQKVMVKQQSLEALAKSLALRLEALGIDPRVRSSILAFPRASATQLRLLLAGGWSVETARTEWSLYRIQHPDASMPQCAFKLLALSAALLLPPRAFYAARQALAQSDLYRRTRQRILRPPEMRHIQKG